MTPLRWLVVASVLTPATVTAQTQLFRLDAPFGDFFGQGVASVGDIDGDGFDDVFVGASQGNAGGGSAPGYARVYSGRDKSVIHTFTGMNASDNFGWCVSSAGDVDADGVPDLMVGAPLPIGAANPGYAQIFSGSTGGLLHTFTGASAADQFGLCLAAAGDVDADGFDDVIIGASFDSRVQLHAGSAWVYSGQTGALLYQYDGEASDEFFGFAVTGLGDVDADGHDDFAVAADLNDRGGVDAGAVFVYSGQTGAELRVLVGDNAGDNYGRGISGIGDVNADGIPDLVVSAMLAGTSGKAYVESGLDGSRLREVEGDNQSWQFGRVCSAAGDTNGDGIDDFLVGDLLDSRNGFENGAAWLFSGADGSLLHSVFGEAGDTLGASVAGGGDLNGDGFADWWTGAFQNSSVAVYSGKRCKARARNYGTGWPGLLGIPELTADPVPALGASFDVHVGNASGVTANTLFLVGVQRVSIPTNFGGTLLVLPLFSLNLSVPVAGLDLPGSIPCDTSLCGLTIQLQTIQSDAAASRGWSFSEGLELIVGGT